MVRTDVVVEAQECAAEFCGKCWLLRPMRKECSGHHGLPLSPFMITHIREPTHLSMSSGVRLVLIRML